MGFNSGFKGLKAIDIQYNEMALSKKNSLVKVCGVAVQGVCWAQRCAVCLKGSPLMERNSIEGTCDTI